MTTLFLNLQIVCQKEVQKESRMFKSIKLSIWWTFKLCLTATNVVFIASFRG